MIDGQAPSARYSAAQNLRLPAGREFAMPIHPSIAALAAAGLVALAAPVLAMTAAERDRLERRSEEFTRQQERQAESDARRRALEDELRERGEALNRRIDELRARIEACGRCAERDALQAQLDRIETERQEKLQAACRTFSAMGGMGAGAGNMIASIPGLREACGGGPTPEQRAAREEAQRVARQPLEDKARGGNPDDVLALARWREQKERDLDAACRIVAAPAGQGHPPSIVMYAGRCLIESASAAPADRERGWRLLRDCAASGHDPCRRNLEQREALRRMVDERRSSWEARRPTETRREAMAAAREALAASREAEQRQQEDTRRQEHCRRQTDRADQLQRRLGDGAYAERQIAAARERQRRACAD